MNKQELIEKIENLNKLYGERHYVAIDDVLNLVSQLDESEKVKIPDFAADVIEGARGHSAELEDALFYAHEHGNQDFKKWYGKLENRENFARAFLDGYDIKQEKRYKVILKNVETGSNTLLFIFSGGGWSFRFFHVEEYYHTAVRDCHTRKELEQAGFSWVFDCPGIEIEEVKR